MLQTNKDAYQLARNFTSEEEKISFELIGSDSKILEIGCNAGRYSRLLRDRKNCFVVGVDFDSRIQEEAKVNTNSFILGSVENDNIFEKFEEQGSFDFIVLLHVIEHLVDPWKTLGRLRALLKDKGKIICATPNIANWNSRALLFLKGRWEYQDTGVMDRTHLRFFTKKTLEEAFINSGFNIEQLRYLHPTIPVIDNIKFLSKYRRYFVPITRRILPPVLWSTVLMVTATPSEHDIHPHTSQK